MPSFLALIVRSWIWSRPWCAVSMLSDRVSVHLIGLRSFCAISTQSISSGSTPILPPKPPPTSGAITRSFDSGTPRVTVVIVRRMCGTWVAAQIVSCSPVGSTTQERGSMNAGIRRCWRNRRLTTTESESDSAVLIASSTLPPVPASPESNTQVAETLVPRSGCTRSAPSCAAASMSRIGSCGS